MNGISFIVRVKNEENCIEQSIRSISGLTIPHDIHIILNNCTDNTLNIVEKLKNEGMPIQIYTYDYQISRAGYEHLVTDKDSHHSLESYYSWCFSLRKYDWIFKWDADFVMTDEMRNFLNSKTWEGTEKHTRYYIPAKNSDSNSAEHNLFSGPYYIGKYIFWEYIYPIGETIDLETDGGYVIHLSDLKFPKSYWLETPWFMNDEGPEAIVLREKYSKLTEICGQESVGSARRSNPENDKFFWAVKSNENVLKENGIHFYV
jgi:glycosyltransferase involved in cell wall biosynthesis